jgi:hypothetical protein
VALDWCYHEDTGVDVPAKTPLRERPEYCNGDRVWFSFNDYFAWSHKPGVSIDQGRLAAAARDLGEVTP